MTPAAELIDDQEHPVIEQAIIVGFGVLILRRVATPAVEDLPKALIRARTLQFNPHLLLSAGLSFTAMTVIMARKFQFTISSTRRI